MKTLSNQQLEETFTALRPVTSGWRGLDILILESIQLGAIVPELRATNPNEDEIRQLIWYWLIKQCQFKSKAAYKNRDITNQPRNWYRPWYDCDSPSGTILQTRVLELAEFIRNYRTYDKVLGKMVYPNPLVAMSAWHRRFHNMELRRQLCERAGISTKRADLSKMSQVMRFLPINNDVDEAVDRYRQHLEDNYASWLRHHKFSQKEPPLPNDKSLLAFRKECLHYVEEVKPRTENVMSLDFHDDDTFEDTHSLRDMG